VVVTGWIAGEQLGLLYRVADLFAFPSVFERFGIPVLEAMKHGVPVVSSNAASLPEVAGDATIVVDPHNVRQIAEAIHTVLADPELRVSLVGKGYAQARGFSWEEAAR
jgi:glycosyltransferase involved in cell wall biosynthesis